MAISKTKSYNIGTVLPVIIGLTYIFLFCFADGYLRLSDFLSRLSVGAMNEIIALLIAIVPLGVLAYWFCIKFVGSHLYVIIFLIPKSKGYHPSKLGFLGLWLLVFLVMVLAMLATELTFNLRL